jgi:hypothetical protein
LGHFPDGKSVALTFGIAPKSDFIPPASTGNIRGATDSPGIKIAGVVPGQQENCLHLFCLPNRRDDVEVLLSTQTAPI